MCDRPSLAHACLLAAAIAALAGCGSIPTPPRNVTPTPLTIAPVVGLDMVTATPEDNPLTIEKVALGERLFFDRQLSADGHTRCASCHRPALAFSDSVPLSRGVHDRRGRRNAPTLVNRAYGRAFFWDGRVATLEDQVLHPIQDSTEMGQSLAALVRSLRTQPSYRDAFRRAFDGGIESLVIARALASYLRTLRSGDAAVDRWRAGDSVALSPAALRGLSLFTGSANCVACHVGFNFTDERFHNTGIAGRIRGIASLLDSGRAGVTGREEDVGAFKTPTLRDVELTAPYMHDGSLATLEDVVAFYNDARAGIASLDPEIKPLHLTAAQQQDLTAFLRSLTGSRHDAQRR